ncbi:MAG: site-specific integrase [Oceanobacter sp.]
MDKTTRSHSHTARQAELDLKAKEAALLEASRSPHTQRAMEGAVRHFTMVYGGLLPCSGEELKDYLVHYAGELSVATLEQRRVLIGRWHREQGFSANPNDHALVKAVMRGIRRQYGQRQKQARPAPIRMIEQVVQHLDRTILETSDAMALKARRDKALLLTAFWFGLRSDELVRLRVCDVSFHEGQETPCMELYLNQSKTDREGRGQRRTLNALAALCPMAALQAWLAARFQGLELAGQPDSTMPLLAKVSRWDKVSDQPIHINSINKLLKTLLASAGVDPEDYSSHSMRRGIANWIMDSGASVAELTEWIGWRDTRTAMRYLDGKSSLPSKIIERHMAAQAWLENDASASGNR